MGTTEATKYIGLHYQTLWRMIDEEGLPAYRFGRIIRLRRSEIDEFIQSKRIQPGMLGPLHKQKGAVDEKT